MKDVSKIDIPTNGDVVCTLRKKWTNLAMMGCNNWFIICTDASFSSKDGKCAFSCAILFKDVIVYGGSLRG